MRMLKRIFWQLTEKLNRLRFTTCTDQVIAVGDNFTYCNWWRSHETPRTLKSHLCLANSRGEKSEAAPSFAMFRSLVQLLR